MGRPLRLDETICAELGFDKLPRLFFQAVDCWPTEMEANLPPKTHAVEISIGASERWSRAWGIKPWAWHLFVSPAISRAVLGVGGFCLKMTRTLPAAFCELPVPGPVTTSREPFTMKTAGFCLGGWFPW